jgi:putative SOS response-associated peptidase YedK
VDDSPENSRLPLAQLPTAFNARAEELGNKRLWSRSFNARRCLVPATGWREFTGASGQRQPHHFHYDHRLFAFAGIGDHWFSPDGVGVRSFAIVTVPANDTVTPVHDRMPLRAEPELYAQWLDPKVPGAEALLSLRNASSPSLDHYETVPLGNDAHRPDRIAPSAKAARLFS